MEKFEECFQNLKLVWEGPRCPCSHASVHVRHLYFKVWAGLNGFEPNTKFKLGSMRISMGCMNLVTVIA